MRKPRPLIERLREVIAYDARTGRLTWKISPVNGVAIGDEAGSVSRKGYIHVQVDGVVMLAHRVIFAMRKGRWPTNQIDHRDLDKANNRWRNLREATNSQNKANGRRANSTGFKGVAKNHAGFKAQIRFEGRYIYLGTYPTPEEAHAIYAIKAKDLFGEFARVA